MSPDAERWLARLARLKVDKARGNPAPHKPLLLLLVLDLVEEGRLISDDLPLTPELAFQFCTYWSIVAHRRTQRPDIRYPFFHLMSDGLWTALDAGGAPASERREARTARLSPGFLALAQDPTWRAQARRVLISTYFEPQERVALASLLGLPVPTEDEVAHDAAYPDPDAAARRGREARFRLRVVSAYGHTCALTRYRVTTIAGSSLVDAAHIHEFASSRNNDPRNGLALSKNAHWLFDQGLWSLTDNFLVLVAREAFAEEGPEAHLLRPYAGRPIHLPADHRLWPDPEFLGWHRRKRFQGA
jgi:putative restriction endonuclease